MSESNELYNRRLTAARFMLEAGEGAQFQYLSGRGTWQPCDAVAAFGFMLDNFTQVRLRPTPKKVLRPAWEIIKMMADLNCITFDGGINTRHEEVSFAMLWANRGKSYPEIGRNWPDEWFTEVEG